MCYERTIDFSKHVLSSHLWVLLGYSVSIILTIKSLLFYLSLDTYITTLLYKIHWKLLFELGFKESVEHLRSRYP